MEAIINWFNSLGANVLSKLLPLLLIVIVGVIVIRIVMTIVGKALEKSKLEKAAHSLIKSVLRVLLFGLLALIAAGTLGIDVTGVVALASVASLALSLALQNSLTNLIGGFTLLYTKPFSSGDFVEVAGRSGTVKEIGMAYTKLLTPDNKLVQIPNSAVVATDITNFSCTGTRRVEVAASASYNAPVDKVMAALREAAMVEGLLEDPRLYVAISSYGDHAIHYVVRVWCPTAKYWDVFNAIQYNVKVVFDREGIEMTYPHLNVHLEK